MRDTPYRVGDAITWLDSDAEEPVQRHGAITEVLSSQLLVACTDGRERFVMLSNSTLRPTVAK